MECGHVVRVTAPPHSASRIPDVGPEVVGTGEEVAHREDGDAKDGQGSSPADRPGYPQGHHTGRQPDAQRGRRRRRRRCHRSNFHRLLTMNQLSGPNRGTIRSSTFPRFNGPVVSIHGTWERISPLDPTAARPRPDRGPTATATATAARLLRCRTITARHRASADATDNTGVARGADVFSRRAGIRRIAVDQAPSGPVRLADNVVSRSRCAL